MLGRKYPIETIHYFDLMSNYMLPPKRIMEECVWMARAFLLHLLGAYLFTNGGQTVSLRWLTFFKEFVDARRANWGQACLTYLYSSHDTLSQGTLRQLVVPWKLHEQWIVRSTGLDGPASPFLLLKIWKFLPSLLRRFPSPSKIRALYLVERVRYQLLPTSHTFGSATRKGKSFHARVILVLFLLKNKKLGVTSTQVYAPSTVGSRFLYFQPTIQEHEELVWLVRNLKLEVTNYSRSLYGPVGVAYPGSSGDDDDDGGNEEDSEATLSYQPRKRVDEPLLRAATNYWVPTRHVFHFNGVELCPIIEEFGAIMGKPKVDNLVFPTTVGDLPFLLQVVLGVPLARTNRWCVFGKLNFSLVFANFSNLAIPVDERPRSYFLRALYLCALARKFGERQGALSGEGAFHTEVFTNRILGRLCEAWPCRRVTRGIAPPRYIYLTTRYKQ
ncbi:hypothetical protein SO802_017622 [Lithocarpus litseifolius]|uniref:Aminotransferase-like plant mobile domain-containing protein n=1 Tax=Lithocarpus litseifolius TaxID=425828 RepID=A0AAW2CIJ9_9ROSI